MAVKNNACGVGPPQASAIKKSIKQTEQREGFTDRQFHDQISEQADSHLEQNQL